MTINFTGQVAIVSGTGEGLGRTHALASRGAHVDVRRDRPTTALQGNISRDAAHRIAAEMATRGGRPSPITPNTPQSRP